MTDLSVQEQVIKRGPGFADVRMAGQPKKVWVVATLDHNRHYEFDVPTIKIECVTFYEDVAALKADAIGVDAQVIEAELS